jgi:DNA-binding response OmpR family regulator
MSTIPGSLRVLVVEDDKDTAASLSWLLRLWGYEPLVALDGITAVEMAHSHRPDLILLDLALPRLDGYNVIRQLRHGLEGARILIWVISGHAHQEARQHALAAGADRYLTKPVDPDRLYQLLCETRAVLRRLREAGPPRPQ